MSLDRDGYAVLDLGGAAMDVLREEKSRIERRIGGPLEQAHRFMPHDLMALQTELRASAGAAGRRALQCQRDQLNDLLGVDLLAQKAPYLRIARPGVSEDNIGFHKDTWYGGTPSEMTAWIPLVDVDENASLKVAPGSHRLEYEIERTSASQVGRGTLGHALGFLYAPKRLKEDVEMRAVPMRCGQMLVMSLAVLHGQVSNESHITRWSLDCRVSPAHADLGKRASVYAPL